MNHFDDDEDRPNPDNLLLHIKKNEQKNLHQGKLKVFLGMAAGVGKTYAMLHSAKILKEKGTDVVIGMVETHGRKETELQLTGHERLPLKVINYKGKVLEDFDLDAALKRKPELIIVDELAHSNPPESRNKKRYLDIIELLSAGIDVYTAVNVQHIESRSHTVKNITDITVRETVPDSFLDLADEILVIDLSPEDLINRLDEGLIYQPERAEIAKNHFFQLGNLTALRELALRTAVERVDKDLRQYKKSHNIKEAWKSSHRLLVAVFASPYAENLIRSTRQLADTLGASWIGAYVEKNEPLDDAEKLLLAKNIGLVQELGGEVITSKDEDPVRGLIRISQQNNVTQIIVGKSARKWWQSLLSGGSFVQRLMRLSGDIDIYCLANYNKDQKNSFYAQRKLLPTSSSFIAFFAKEWYLLLFLITSSWFLANFLKHILGSLSVGFVFLIVVCFSGLYLSRFSVFFMATVFAFLHKLTFLNQADEKETQIHASILLLSMFFITAAVVGHLTTRLRMKEKNLSKREENILASYHLAKSLLVAKGIKEVIRIGASYLETAFPYQVIIFCLYEKKKEFFGSWDYLSMDVREKAVIDWVVTNGQHAGKFTQTLSASSGYFIPLIGKEGVHGVIGVNGEEMNQIDSDSFSTLENYSHQIASALEREIFHKKAKKLES